jgi:hypothetical protein
MIARSIVRMRRLHLDSLGMNTYCRALIGRPHLALPLERSLASASSDARAGREAHAVSRTTFELEDPAAPPDYRTVTVYVEGEK